MKYEVVLTEAVNDAATNHLLHHLRQGRIQEDLCFALWSPSTGASRTTAIIREVILPTNKDRDLHGGASFHPAYLTECLFRARADGLGLAFMHSHPANGWQAMSAPDIVAERDFIAPSAQTTKLPLVGLTVGADGYWSARFWKRREDTEQTWCAKVRVVGRDKYRLYFNDSVLPRPRRRKVLERTYDTWGTEVPEFNLSPPHRRSWSW